MEEGYYEEEDGSRIPYLTDEEKDDLHIKAGTLSDNERTIMQSHVVFTDKILSHMIFGDMYKDVRRMAADDRPYKKPKPVDVAFKILDEEAEAGKVDASLLEYAKDLYLRGSGN